MADLRLEDYTFIDPTELTLKPGMSGLVEVLSGRYWATRKGQLAFFKGRSPICNAHLAVVQRIAAGLPWVAEIVQYSLIVIPVDISETFAHGEYTGLDIRFTLPGVA